MNFVLSTQEPMPSKVKTVFQINVVIGRLCMKEMGISKELVTSVMIILDP